MFLGRFGICFDLVLYSCFGIRHLFLLSTLQHSARGADGSVWQGGGVYTGDGVWLRE